MTAPGASRLPDAAGAALRLRRPADVPALLVLLQRTHEREGYPVRPAAPRLQQD